MKMRENTPEGVLSNWLALQCGMLPGVVCASVYLSQNSTPQNATPQVKLACVWPKHASSTETLAGIARSAISKQNPVVSNKRVGSHVEIASPLFYDNNLIGALSVEIECSSEQQQRAVIQLLQWGGNWLELLLQENSDTDTDLRGIIFTLLAGVLDQNSLLGAASSTATELASYLQCDRVSIGFVEGRRSKLFTINNSALFEEKSNLVRKIESAMDEALDQDSSIVFPQAEWRTDCIGISHAELFKSYSSTYICTVPLGGNGRLFGAITFERNASPFAEKDIEFCEIACSLIGPVLDLKRSEDRSLIAKFTQSIRKTFINLVGPESTSAKITIAAAFALLTFFSLASGAYRVSGNAFLEGTVQQAVIAPGNGYLESATARAGDLVRKGQVLGRLEDKMLKLEQQRWSGQRDQLIREYRAALAKHDRAQSRILSARVSQAEAQLELLKVQLARTEFVAPFDGVVVSGDLSQEFGSPLERGRVLFEIAPLDSYRVVIEVDETEISSIAIGQTGELVLAALPGVVMPIQIGKITPISTAQDRRNYFRVEALLTAPTAKLRPGMQGVGKISIDTRKLIWIWTHKLTDWVRFWLWTWWP